jgi:hypothetical protein
MRKFGEVETLLEMEVPTANAFKSRESLTASLAATGCAD